MGGGGDVWEVGSREVESNQILGTPMGKNHLPGEQINEPSWGCSFPFLQAT